MHRSPGTAERANSWLALVWGAQGLYKSAKVGLAFAEEGRQGCSVNIKYLSKLCTLVCVNTTVFFKLDTYGSREFHQLGIIFQDLHPPNVVYFPPWFRNIA